MKRVLLPRPHRIRFAGRVAILLLLPWMALAVEPPPGGLRNAAEYIVGFVRYVYWRDEGRIDAWTVCIVGDAPVTEDRVYADHQVRGKAFQVKRIAKDAALSECRILDLTALATTDATSVLERTRHQPILAVGTGTPFCTAGGQICLRMDRDPIAGRQAFEVNVSAMREASLDVSARLLTLGSSRTAREGTP